MYPAFIPPSMPTTKALNLSLDDLQAQVIRQVYRRFGLRLSFIPQDLYPMHTRTHYEARRALNRMAAAGLIRLEPTYRAKSVMGRDGRPYRLRLTQRAVLAYRIWQLQ